nr:ammonium transporter [Xanthomonadales bacterium]NIX12733.1 ammonium transporter [Xanthomonadales bacterium]
LADASLMTAAYADYTWYTDFFFQAMFAATAATIVSGAVAERIKLYPFLLFATIFVAISYPITGSWKWGGGWLDELGFYDFAGSTLVHSVGGWGALVGAAMLGPRIGKFVRGRVHPIPGHSMPLATIGVFLLWLGWFGFNGGSVLSADPGLISLVCVTTTIAAAAGGVGAMFTSQVTSKKPDLSITLNGILAGLVGITAGADQMSVLNAAAIGFIAGIIVVLSVMFFDRIRIDDPVGAISVHLVCGIWGTLAVGLFGAMKGFGQVINQLIGILSIGAFTAIVAGVLFTVLKATLGLRVDESEEIEGLDTGEHGNMAYPDFVITQPAGIHGLGGGAKGMSQANPGLAMPKSATSAN